jgi:predicted small secreted protein
VKNRKELSADDVLNQVKRAFLLEGPIEGSWINFEKQPLRKFAVHSTAYNGGITRMEDGELAIYEFLADTKTGTVLDITRSI